MSVPNLLLFPLIILSPLLPAVYLAITKKPGY